MAMGFKDAGDSLIEHLVLHGRSDAIVLPILFCYRHSLELHLKAIAREVHEFETGTSNVCKSHDLQWLTKILDHDSLDEAIESDDDRAVRDAVKDRILEFHAVDPGGTSTRYAERLDLDQLDLGNLREVMDGVSRWLQATCDWLAARRP